MNREEIIKFIDEQMDSLHDSDTMVWNACLSIKNKILETPTKGGEEDELIKLVMKYQGECQGDIRIMNESDGQLIRFLDVGRMLKKAEQFSQPKPLTEGEESSYSNFSNNSKLTEGEVLECYYDWMESDKKGILFAGQDCIDFAKYILSKLSHPQQEEQGEVCSCGETKNLIITPNFKITCEECQQNQQGEGG